MLKTIYSRPLGRNIAIRRTRSTRRKLALGLAGWLLKMVDALTRCATEVATDTPITSAADHIRISTRVAGWPMEVADELVAAGVSAAQADRFFADALQPGRLM
jgi:hypothetical protein